MKRNYKKFTLHLATLILGGIIFGLIEGNYLLGFVFTSIISLVSFLIDKYFGDH